LEGSNAEVACWAGWADLGWKREEVGRGWAGKRREEAGLKPFIGLKLNRVKENQFYLIDGLK
jgi:hypothetical protein